MSARGVQSPADKLGTGRHHWGSHVSIAGAMVGVDDNLKYIDKGDGKCREIKEASGHERCLT